MRNIFIFSALFFVVFFNTSYSQTTFSTVGSQTFTATSTGCYKVEAWGAKGGDDAARLGGNGGYATGTIILTSGQTVTVNVAGAGQNSATSAAGGWNGGGTAGSSGSSGGGGGASDVRVGGTALSNRVLVAGGGGGAGNSGSSGAGGAGGGLTGINAGGYGGSQTAGGFGSAAGTLGIGGTRTSGDDGGGGGGGYYGGGAGTGDNGGGGGSSYIGGVSNGSTIAGNTSMPSPTGGIFANGNAGNGYVKITFISSIAFATCPSTVSVNASAGQCTATASWTLPTWTGCQPVVAGANYIGANGGNYYFYVPGSFTWTAAKTDAISKGGRLVSIINAAENTFLNNYLTANAISNAWIGYTDQTTEGNFVSATGVPLSFGNSPSTSYGVYNNWGAGEPNDVGGEDFAIMNSGGAWNDLPGSSTSGYFLECGVIQTAGLSSGATNFPIGTTTVTYQMFLPGLTSAVTCTFSVNVTSTSTAAVAITASPAGTICAGSSVTFTASPSGYAGSSPSYQWKVNGGNVGTNSTTFTTTTLTNGQSVTCVMTPNFACPATSTVTSNSITMTVTPTVPASVSISSSPGTNVCIGTNVLFTATPVNGGTPLYQWRLDGSNVGTNSSTYSNNSLTNSSIVTCVMTSTATCATGSPATSNSLTNLVPASPMLLSGSATAVCQVTNGSNWVRFLDPSGRLVVSIKPTGTNNLGLVTAQAYDHGASVLTQACNSGTNPEWTTAVLGRSWRIAPTNNLAADVEFPFETAELTDLITASSNTVANPKDDVSVIGNLKMSRFHDNNSGNGNQEDGGWLNNCLDGGTVLNSVQLGNGSTPAAIAGAQYVRFATPSFSEFWLHGNTSASPLPITMVDFTATCEGNGDVRLNWSTASEQNSSYFKVERSRDFKSWNYVATIAAAGNSTTYQTYESTDLNALGGTSYYRLVQVDFNGETTVFGPVSVSCGSGQNSSLSVYPNPTKGDFVIELVSDKNYENATIQLLDVTGKLMLDRLVNIDAGKNQIYNEQFNLQVGTYIVRIVNGPVVQPLKVVFN